MPMSSKRFELVNALLETRLGIFISGELFSDINFLGKKCCEDVLCRLSVLLHDIKCFEGEHAPMLDSDEALLDGLRAIIILAILDEFDKYFKKFNAGKSRSFGITKMKLDTLQKYSLHDRLAKNLTVSSFKSLGYKCYMLDISVKPQTSSRNIKNSVLVNSQHSGELN